MIKKSIFALILLLVTPMYVTAQDPPAKDSPVLAGPMLGHVEMKEANLWLQTRQAADVTIRYWNSEGNAENAREYRGKTSRETSNTLQAKLTDLKFGAAYRYEIHVDGARVDFPYPLEFTTQQLWQWRRGAPDFSIAMGSCLYINDPNDDRPGEPYGADPGILKTIADKNPDLMLWLGDNLYYREPDFFSMEQMDRRYRDARDTPEMQQLLATAVNIATWDDHDYGPNNSDRSYRMREQALEIFKRYWANPSYGTLETKGVFTRYQYNDVEIYLGDDRFYRAPNRLKNEGKPFLGKRQLRWLKNSLLSSPATFKLVVVGNQVTNKANRHEAMYHYDREYRELMNFLDNHPVQGVIFLTGDRHFTELLKTEREGGYPLYEFTSSPLSAGTYSSLDGSDEFDNPLRVEGTLVHREHNFGMIRVSGERGNRKLKLQTYGRDGRKIWEHIISEKELKNK